QQIESVGRRILHATIVSLVTDCQNGAVGFSVDVPGRGRVGMRVARSVGLVLSLMVAILPSQVQAQKPAPVEDVSSFPPKTPQDEQKALHVPPGFEIQLVAAEPDIHKPLNLAFDDKGRLWVTDTVEYPYPAKDGIKPRDTVKVLSDFGPDGKARSIRTFADG